MKNGKNDSSFHQACYKYNGTLKYPEVVQETLKELEMAPSQQMSATNIAAMFKAGNMSVQGRIGEWLSGTFEIILEPESRKSSDIGRRPHCEANHSAWLHWACLYTGWDQRDYYMDSEDYGKGSCCPAETSLAESIYISTGLLEIIEAPPPQGGSRQARHSLVSETCTIPMYLLFHFWMNLNDSPRSNFCKPAI